MYRGKFERRDAPAAVERGPRIGSLIFYLLFCLCLFLFWLGVYLGLSSLNVWLRGYEAAQPDTVCQAVFDALFSDPDWEELYDRAGQEEGLWEGKEAFVAVLEDKVGSASLTYMETSAGLSEGRKYIVCLGTEKIAAFTLKNHAASDDDTTLADWRLDGLEFFIEGSQRYTIRAPGRSSVFVNGRKLQEEHIIAITTSAAQDYLPVGTNAPQGYTWQITGLLTVPDITVETEAGERLPVTYDPEHALFLAESAPAEIGEEERNAAVNAVKTYALYMINRAGTGELAKYFNRSSDTYRAITGATLAFVQDAAKREFSEESVTDYCRYSDDLFSVRVSLNLKLYRSDGSVKNNPVDQTLFFSRNPGGKWLCYAMTAMDVSETKEQVRLTFRQGDTVLLSGFFDADAGTVTCPQPSVPSGSSFTGWTVEETDESGNTVLRLVFQPDADGTVTLPQNTALTFMTLYPLFE